MLTKHCLKSVCIRSFSGPYFPAFGLNTERCLNTKSECRKIRTRKTPNTDTFHAAKGSKYEHILVCKLLKKDLLLPSAFSADKRKVSLSTKKKYPNPNPNTQSLEVFFSNVKSCIGTISGDSIQRKAVQRGVAGVSCHSTDHHWTSPDKK